MKAQVDQVMKTARNSLKLLETLEKESVAKAKTAKAKTMVKLDERKKQTNDRIQAGMKSIGFATQTEVNELKARVAQLEKTVANLARAAGI